MARDDDSAVVRLYLAAALQRIAATRRWPIARELMQHGEDAGDHNLPTMIWLAIEPLVAEEPAVALEHAVRSRIPLVARFTARRAVDADALEPLVAALAKTPAAQVSLLEGMRDGLEGRVDVSAPPELDGRLRPAEARSGPVAKLAAEVAASVRRYRLGSPEHGDRPQPHGRARRSQARLADACHAAPAAARRRAARELGDPPLRLDAIRAIAAFDDDGLGKLLIERYPTFTPAEKTEAIQTLASRPRYGRMLAEAIAKRPCRRRTCRSLPRQLLRVVGMKFLEVWGPIERRATEEKAYGGTARCSTTRRCPPRTCRTGAAIYLRTCGACHRMHGEGGTIGPDLTGSNRTNLSYLLLNVLEPNAEVPDAYKLVVITTRDGRTYSGNVVSETDRQLTLRHRRPRRRSRSTRPTSSRAKRRRRR